MICMVKVKVNGKLSVDDLYGKGKGKRIIIS